MSGEKRKFLRKLSIRLTPTTLIAMGVILTFTRLAGAAEPQEAVVVVPVANMYSSASQDVDVVSQAILGTDVELLEENSGWEKVRTNDAYTGWTQSSNVRRLESGAAEYAASGRVAQVSSLAANLYRETDVTLHQPVATVPFETRMEIVSQGQGDAPRWLQVRLPDGQTAWIQAGDVNLAPHKLSIKESIALGRRFLGVTYTWGGRSSFGYDCSGFTQMLVRSRGITMPRDADLQAGWSGAEPVDRKKLKAGDLLFFGDAPDHITHTGMFIGHGKFIHDTTHDHPGVQISRLKDQPWTRLLVACRRIQ
jgi:cell wall-associated NlpC family hydrolase